MAMTGAAVTAPAGTGFAVAGIVLALIFMPARPGPPAGTRPEPRGGDRIAARHPA